MVAATPFLALVRGLIGFLASELAPIPDAAMYKDGQNVCDDGGEPFTDDGFYRDSCTHEGCGMNDEVCYFNDYFERCLDAYGRPTGRCSAAVITCAGVIGCFSMWIDCGGQYACNEEAYVGCKNGTCNQG
jgi:hypothetical protein